MFRWLLPLVIIASSWQTDAQNLLDERRVDWSSAGASMDIISPEVTLNILDYGGDPDGTTPNQNAFNAAVAASTDQPTIIYFPPGNYYFTQRIFVPSDIIVKGAGSDSTFLNFNLNGTRHCIAISGSRSQIEIPATHDICKGQFHIRVADTVGLVAGDYFLLLFDDSDLINDSWANNSVGQINRIVAVGADRIFVEHGIRRDYLLVDSPYVEPIDPIVNSGIECLHIERQDATNNNFGLIRLNLAAECYVRSVTGNMCSYAHVILDRSTKCTISGNYFHHAHDYGSGGNAYGVACQNTSGDNLITNNIFEHLRHSILLQAGANGNVISYNYSTDPFKTIFGLPSNNTADLVCHGNYPYANLFEGNIASFGIIDASHGQNGPYNTYFRNRMDLYGMQISNATPDNDSQNIIGNEVNNYNLSEIDHYEYGNNQSGSILPPNTDTIDILSYYLLDIPDFIDTLMWPSIGYPNTYQSGSIPAKERYEVMQFTSPCPKHDSCPTMLQIDDISYHNPEYKASEVISSSAQILPFQVVNMKAGSEINLQYPFESKFGGELYLSIDTCTSTN